MRKTYANSELVKAARNAGRSSIVEARESSLPATAPSPARAEFGHCIGQFIAVEEPTPNRTGLPDSLKSGIESLSGVLLDGLRVHYNSSKPAQLSALAIARDPEIHLAPGQERYLPHEAWHIVQQRQGRVQVTTHLQGVGLNDDPALEAEADRMGTAALQARLIPGERMRLAPAATPAQYQVLQRGKAKKKKEKVKIYTRNASTKNGSAGTISSIKFGSRPTSNCSKQGQHISSYAIFQDMIRSHALDKSLDQAAIALRDDVLPEITDMHTSRHYQRQLDALAPRLTAISSPSAQGNPRKTANELEAVIYDILSARNKVPGTAAATKNTGGHGEASSLAGLRVKEDALRRNGGPPHDWNEDKVALEAGFEIWKLMDVNPVGRNTESLIKALKMHINQMALSYPQLFHWLSSQQRWRLVPLLLNHDKHLPLGMMAKEKRMTIVDQLTNDGW